MHLLEKQPYKYWHLFFFCHFYKLKTNEKICKCSKTKYNCIHNTFSEKLLLKLIYPQTFLDIFTGKQVQCGEHFDSYSEIF